MFVDKDVYKQLKELKDRSHNLYDVYTFLNGNDPKYRIAYWWLHAHDGTDNLTHEKDILNWLAGNIEIEPRPDKQYMVYQSLGKDTDQDEWFVGLRRVFGKIIIDSVMDCCKFAPLTEDEIEQFQADTEIEFPRLMWHPVEEEKEEEMPF